MHRKTLLLTDRLADSQRAASSAASLEGDLVARRPTQASVGVVISAIERALASTENEFQHLRHSIKQMALEMTIAVAEAGYAAYELINPEREREGWEAWSALTAGLTGVFKTLRDA